MLKKGKASVTIESIVDDLPNITYKQILYEAITNSIQADAKKISITFIYNSVDFHEKDIKVNGKSLESILIKDDGIGFNNKNIEAFKEYKTKNKFDLGCKGVGRFLYLKLFGKVEIESLDKKIEFVTDRDIEAITTNDKLDTTTVRLLEPKDKISIDYDNLEKDIREHFIAYFKLLKDENKKIEITIYEENNKKHIITSDKIANFIEKKFKIGSHTFILNYVFNEEGFSNQGYYCAGKRVVKKNSELDGNKKIKLFKQFNILFLLESEYLDKNVKSDTRDDFTIYSKRRNDDIFSNLSWEEIKDTLKLEIENIAKEHKIDINKIAKNNLKKAIESAPYLGFYLKNNSNMLDSEDLIKDAKTKLEGDKKTIRKGEDVDYHKLSVVTQSELAEYIYDRQSIIDKLKALTDYNSVEEELHNLFMKKYTSDENEDYKSNNLWLFDDRFMSYDKVFSEAQLQEIFPELIKNLERPDILSIGEMNIISNTYEKEDITDIVIIELKKASEKITPARAEEQLIDYAGYINEAYENKKIRIWTYAFLKFDEKTEKSFKNKGYNRVLTKSKYPIYYLPFNEVNTIVNFVDYNAIADDANNRNKTFMKILKGNDII